MSLEVAAGPPGRVRTPAAPASAESAAKADKLAVSADLSASSPCSVPFSSSLQPSWPSSAGGADGVDEDLQAALKLSLRVEEGTSDDCTDDDDYDNAGRVESIGNVSCDNVRRVYGASDDVVAVGGGDGCGDDGNLELALKMSLGSSECNGDGGSGEGIDNNCDGMIGEDENFHAALRLSADMPCGHSLPFPLLSSIPPLSLPSFPSCSQSFYEHCDFLLEFVILLKIMYYYCVQIVSL
jgi:hypothetical protein